MKTEFRDVIRTVRRQNGLSQGELAKKMGLSSGQIVSNWERGYGTEMKLTQFKKFLRVFKLNQNELLALYINYRKQLLINKIESEWKELKD